MYGQSFLFVKSPLHQTAKDHEKGLFMARRHFSKEIVSEALSLFDEAQRDGDTPPPAYNMEVVTPKGAVKALIDWVSVTFPTFENPELAKDLIGGDWVEMDHGHHGYKSGCVQGGVMVLYDGGGPNMGVHIQMTGKGCRQLEASGRIRNWQEFLGELRSLGGRFTRIDGAFDDTLGLITMADVETALRSKTIVSRWRQADPRQTVSLAEGAEENGKTIYFGSPTSDVKSRFYDKARQQGCPAGVHWVRVEIECRRERAGAYADAVIDGGAEAMAGVLKSYIDFKERGADSHRDRWKSAEWWQGFLHCISKCRLMLDPVVQTIEGAKMWVQNAVAPTLAVLFAACGGDVEEFGRQVYNWCRDGKSRWKGKHRALLAAAGV